MVHFGVRLDILNENILFYLIKIIINIEWCLKEFQEKV